MEEERKNPEQETYNPYTYNPYAQQGRGALENAGQQDYTRTTGETTQGYARTAGEAQQGYARQSGEAQQGYARQSGEARQSYAGAAGSASQGTPPYGYRQQNYAASQAGPTRQKNRRSGGFGRTLAKTAAIALVFGLVAGVVFTGISFAGSKLLGITAAGNNNKGVQQGQISETEQAMLPDHQAASGEISQTTATGYAAELTDVSAIVDEIKPSIVAITNTSTVTYHSFWGQSQSYQSESCGSGIIISSDEDYLYIATNNHVVAQAEGLSVKFSDESIVAAETRGCYPTGDLAVVMVKLSDIEEETKNLIKIAAIGDSAQLKVGEPTIAIGNALGYGQSVTTGIVSALDRSVTTQDSTTGTKITNNNLIQTDAAINPGNSGGALLNKNGEVIGINSVKYSDTSVEGIGYAIPMETAMPILNSLINDGKYVDTQSAYLGISGADVTQDISETYHMPQGVYISSVYAGTGAYDAKLIEGDIITQIGSVEIKNMEELRASLADYSAGDTVTITFYRRNNSGYKEYHVDVTLSSAEAMENQ